MIDLNNYTPPEKACKCGKTHAAYTKTIILSDSAIEKLPEVCKQIISQCRIGIVCDENVKGVAAEAESLLVRAGYRTRTFTLPADFVFSRKNTEQLINTSEDLRLWLAVGCGSIADAVRYASSCRGNEWILFPTAPTTDAMLYPYCDFFEDGARVTVKANPPVAVVGDYTAIESAPKYTVAAGYGTLVSKLLRAFDFAFDKVTDKRRCSFLTDEFCETVTDFFCNQSCELMPPRILRTLLKLGIIAQLADEEDFCQGGEYFAARCLKAQCDDKRLTGENAMICTLVSYCILDSYLSASPEDLFIPSSLPEHFRYLDKNCGISSVRLLGRPRRASGCEESLYVLKEYAGDLGGKIKEYFGNAKGLARQFRRLYDDAGYWLGSYCSCDTALKTVCCANAAVGEGLLSSVVIAGALEPLLNSGTD